MDIVYHKPALLHPCMEHLVLNPSGVYVDVTFGGGGHSRGILSRLSADGRLFGFDQDLDALANVPDDKRFTFVRSNFRYLANFMAYHGVSKVDGILADLGVSFHHFDEAERGFSFRFEDELLDMRMNQTAAKTAAHVLNTYSEEELSDIFYLYGELKSARRLASLIVRARESRSLERIGDLVAVVDPVLGADRKKKDMAKLFQAVRIEVNDEMDVLKQFLLQTRQVLAPGGRLVVLTYHSLEDRLVKNFLKSGNFEGKVEQDFYGNRLAPFKLVNNKVIVADDEEVAENPRARSAKLRAAELL